MFGTQLVNLLCNAVVCICALHCCTLQSNYAPRVKHNLLKLLTLCVEIRLKNAKRLKTYSQTDIFSEVRLQRLKHGSTGIVFNPEAVVVHGIENHV